MALLNVAMFSCTKQDLSDENTPPMQYSDCCDEDGEILPPPPPPPPPADTGE